MKKALLVIDIQNDYFPGGRMPLWNTEQTLKNIERVIKKANENNVPVIHVQHVANGGDINDKGAQIHPRILELAPNGKRVVKHYADSFYETNLEDILSELEIEELIVCGMMTQNCVTHTAISKSAEKYEVRIIPECCTTVNEMIHMIALDAVSTRIKFISIDEAI